MPEFTTRSRDDHDPTSASPPIDASPAGPVGRLLLFPPRPIRLLRPISPWLVDVDPRD